VEEEILLLDFGMYRVLCLFTPAWVIEIMYSVRYGLRTVSSLCQQIVLVRSEYGTQKLENRLEVVYAVIENGSLHFLTSHFTVILLALDLLVPLKIVLLEYGMPPLGIVSV
jgi:hypothetical protein